MADVPHIIWVHKSFEIDTVFKFLKGQFTLSIVQGMSIGEFLDYEGVTGIKNIDRLFEKYDEKEREEFAESKEEFELGIFSETKIGTLPMKIHTELVLPKDRLNRRVLAIVGRNQIVKQTQFKTFLAKKHEDLLKNPQYQQVSKQKARYYSITKETYPDISVWLWLRSRSDEKDKEPQGTIINISSFIQTMSINVTETGGNWQLRLAPVTIEESIRKFGIDFVSDNILHTIDDNDELKRSDFFFHNIISTNDLIFIRFESLESEDLKDRNDLSFEVSKDRLVGNIYDMIGLVDSNVVSMNAANGDVSIDVTGRDLIKLLIEDGSYFFPIQFATDLFINIQDNKKLVQRLVTTGKFYVFAGFRSIRRTLQFVMNHLSHTGVVPDNLFDAYGSVVVKDKEGREEIVDERTYVFRIDDEQAGPEIAKRQDHKKKIAEQKEKAKKAIIQQRKEVGIKEPALDKKDGVIESIRQDLVDFLNIASTKPSASNPHLRLRTINGEETVVGWEEVVDGEAFTFRGKIVEKDTLPEFFRGKFLPDCVITFPFRQELIKLRQEKLRRKASEPSATPLPIDHTESWADREIEIAEGSTKEKIFELRVEAGGFETEIKTANRKIVIITQQLTGLTFFTEDDLNKAKEQKKVAERNLKRVESELKKLRDEQDSLRRRTPIKDLTPEQLDERIAELEKLQDVSEEDCPPIPLKSPDKVIQEVWKFLKWEKQEFQLPFKDKLTNGVWQIIKLVLDENITDRRLVDDSISQPDGSLLNHFNKVCHKPFVEFFTDTYGDKFFFIARQPPFTGEAIIEFIDTKGLVIPIEEEDVIFDSLGFNETDVYSWYQIEPQGSLLGERRKTIIDIIPAVYFPEYADIWGSRRLQVVTPYITFKGLVHDKEEEDKRYFFEQVVRDFVFLIDIYAYVPFTRKGTITINGDRRIKRGTWIRYKSTNEIYYVDAVSNSYSISNTSIDRVTTLQVSRGMKEEFIKGKEVTINGKTIDVSYFNIVDTKFIKEQIIERLEFRREALRPAIQLEQAEKELKENGAALQKRTKTIEDRGKKIVVTERELLVNKIGVLKNTIEQRQKLAEEDRVLGGKVLSGINVKQNFGVNSEVFNFFLRRQQFKK